MFSRKKIQAHVKSIDLQFVNVFLSSSNLYIPIDPIGAISFAYVPASCDQPFIYIYTHEGDGNREIISARVTRILVLPLSDKAHASLGR